ncbi:MAG: glycosyltransferase family 1 protein [Prevotella sp.]|nr:glycosyltransferase family 1 protein [Prevotella sp.]
MKILLLNECSNVHATLAKGLRELGHTVTVVSGGNGWRNYPRDISIVRRSASHLDGIRYIAQLYATLPRLRGYDAVQINNPIFFDIRAERLFAVYNYLRRHNGAMVMGAFGTDYYWVHTCMNDKPLRYSDHNFGDEVRTGPEALVDQREWIGTTKERLNRYIAADCDGIVPCLYEYWACYQPVFPDKTRFIPLPIVMPDNVAVRPHDRLKVFIGIDRDRNVYKGTDIMLRAAQDLLTRYPEQMELQIAESVPFAEYEQMMNDSDVILDQLYSYTPSMNSLLAMSKGIVVIGGGEPENYELINEKELRPIINVQPSYESVYMELEQLLLHPERLPELKRQSIEYVRRHHDYRSVARQYADFYQDLR